MSVSHALADIHQDDVSIAISPQTISGRLKGAVESFLDENPNFKSITTMSSENALDEVSQFAEGTIPTGPGERRLLLTLDFGS